MSDEEPELEEELLVELHLAEARLLLDEEKEQEQEEVEEEQQGTVPATSTVAMSKNVTFQGVSIEVSTNGPTAATLTNSCLYPKEERATMTSDKLNELFDRATRERQTKYDILTMSITDTDKLDDTYNLQVMVMKTKTHCVRYDMENVFQVIKTNPEDKTEIIGVTDLYADYTTLTQKDVATSNKWYKTMTVDPQRKYFDTNLKLTYDYLENNIEPRLLSKCHETYSQYPSDEQGGPLLFKIMIDQLQVSTEAATRYFLNLLRDLKVSAFDGENIDQVVSMVRAAVQRLKNLKDPRTLKNAIPENLQQTLLDIFQTTSVAKFNALFAHMSQQIELKNMLSAAAIPSPSVTVDDLISQ
jgi:hypothetical protein